MRGKNINLFLMDGDAAGRIKCSLNGWTGVAYKIPRTQLENCVERSELKQSGVYFLFGYDENDDKQMVYVGQAGMRKNGEGILSRLFEHKRNPDKTYWNEAVVFTTQNNSLGPTEISYLEHCFCELARKAGRYVVMNGNDPSIGNVTEEMECDLSYFIDNARLIMGVLGHKVFEPLLSNLGNKDGTQEGLLELFFVSKVLEAKAVRTTEGIVLLRDSQISSTLKPSCPDNVRKAREKYKDKISKDFITLDDILFTSPSAAAAFVGGSSLSGNMLWRNKEGVLLKDLEKLS